jgi:uncharacterized membrane protein (DUF4010 family)
MIDVQRAFEDLAISLCLGLLVGLQRQRAESSVAGFRTFALITLFGTICAILAQDLGGWVVAVGLGGVIAASVVGNLNPPKPANGEGRGITTEIAMLLMFAVGAFVVVGARNVAVAVGCGVAVLLHAKATLHTLAARMVDKDVRAIMQFVLITFIILPVLPDETFGPFAVLNPREIWLMVVLIVGMSLGAYIAYHFLPPQSSLVLGGLLGGMVSSTATTVSYARRAATSMGLVHGAVLVILIATAVMYVRVLAEVGVVAPRHFAAVSPPIFIVLGATVIMSVIAWFSSRRRAGSLAEQGNPTELRSALFFAAMYAIVKLAIAAAKEYLGDRGIYAVAGLSGLTDMDAITLSAARLLNDGRLDATTAWHAILIGTIGNMVFKAAVIASLGGLRLFRRVSVYYAASIVIVVALLAFWPHSPAPAPADSALPGAAAINPARPASPHDGSAFPSPEMP